MRLVDIPQEKLLPPADPVRATIDLTAVDELAESISAVGLLQPLIVRPVGESFEVVAGHRRLLATRKIAIDPVPCLIVEAQGNELTIAGRLHENIFRVELSAIEEAAVYAELYEQLLDTDKVAAAVRRSRTVVERRLHLLELDDLVRGALQDGKISVAVAEELAKVDDDTKRSYLLNCAIADGATAPKVRMWRKEFEGISLVPEGTGTPGQTGATRGPEPDSTHFCWLCGSMDDQHELRVKMMHTYCERMYKQAQRQAAQPEGVDERAG